jgi:hypothetical protein
MSWPPLWHPLDVFLGGPTRLGEPPEALSGGSNSIVAATPRVIEGSNSSRSDLGRRTRMQLASHTRERCRWSTWQASTPTRYACDEARVGAAAAVIDDRFDISSVSSSVAWTLPNV